jgi:nitroreductase
MDLYEAISQRRNVRHFRPDVDFPRYPLLEEVGWRARLPLRDVVFFERYGRRAP